MEDVIATTQDYQIGNLARAVQHAQRAMLAETEDEEVAIPYCARTGPFFDWATRSCSDEWLLEVSYPAIPAARRVAPRRGPEVNLGNYKITLVEA